MKTAYLVKSDVGATLSTFLYCCMWQLYTAEKLGYAGYIHWPQQPNRSLLPHQDPAKFAEIPNMYDWWFVQPGVPAGPPPPPDDTFEWEHWQALGEHPLMSQPLSFIREWFQARLVFNPEIQRRTDELVAKYEIDFSNTLAVSWRGCDSVDDGRPRLAIETYFPFIDDVLANEPNLRIFATAEETSVVDKIKARYPQTFTIDEFFSAPYGYKLHSEYINPVSGYERGVQTCQMIGILSRCKHYIKNRSSMSSVAAWLSHGRIVSLAHPENLGHGFDLTKAEINGQLVPLYR